MKLKRAAHVVRSATPVPIRKAFRRLGQFFGYGLPDRFPSIEGSLTVLHRLGLRPRFCVDVGAYQGEWTKLYRSIFPDSKVLMIEAQESKRDALQEVAGPHPAEISMEIALLGPADDEVVDFTEMETGSSVFAEKSPYARNVIKKKTRRLDSLLKSGGHPGVDFLKLDVQGYELQVLKGASDALAQASAVLMEASLVPVNSGCPLAAEVIVFMNGAGFRLFDFCSQIRRKDGVLWQTDLLFLREGSALLPAPGLTRDNWG